MKNVQETIEFIKVMHHDQFDWSGVPYWEHPVAVMHALLPMASDEDRMIALLHDVIEDCRIIMAKHFEVESASKVTISMGGDYLKQHGFSDYVIEGVKLDTRIDGHYFHQAYRTRTAGTYMDYINNIIASKHLGAMMTKLADNQQNTDPMRTVLLNAFDKAKAANMAQGRYRIAREAIVAGLASMGVSA